MEFSRPEYWSGEPFPSPGHLPNPGVKSRSPTPQVDFLPAEPQGKPKNTGVGSLSLLQGIFPTQEANWGLLHCRQIFYQLSYEGRPSDKEPACQCKRCKRVGFDPWVRKIPWRRAWQLTPVLGHEESSRSNYNKNQEYCMGLIYAHNAYKIINSGGHLRSSTSVSVKGRVRAWGCMCRYVRGASFGEWVRVYVVVVIGCHDKMPQTTGLKQHTLIPHRPRCWRSKVKALAGFVLRPQSSRCHLLRMSSQGLSSVHKRCWHLLVS